MFGIVFDYPSTAHNSNTGPEIQLLNRGPDQVISVVEEALAQLLLENRATLTIMADKATGKGKAQKQVLYTLLTEFVFIVSYMHRISDHRFLAAISITKWMLKMHALQLCTFPILPRTDSRSLLISGPLDGYNVFMHNDSVMFLDM